jgi:hypothetical protein
MNYYFINYFPKLLTDWWIDVHSRVPLVAKFVGSYMMYPYTVIGSFISSSMDYWGPSKDNLLYMSPQIIPTVANAFAILNSPQNLQLSLYTIKKNYDKLTEEFSRERNEYPINAAFDVRITGVDDPKEIGVKGAEAPLLSSASPSLEHPEFTLVVWVELAGYLGSPGISWLTKIGIATLFGTA